MVNKTFEIQGNGFGLYRVISVKDLKLVEVITDYKFKTKDEARKYITSLDKVNAE